MGKDFPLLAKLNLSDGLAGGLGIDESCKAAQLLQRLREQGEGWRSPCNHCNQCVASMALPGGIRCTLNQPNAFG